MTGAAGDGYDWAGLWQTCNRLLGAAWAGAADGRTARPLEDAVERFRRFGEQVTATLAGVAPAAQADTLAAACERLAAGWNGDDQAEWFALPLTFAAGSLDDASLDGFLVACARSDAWTRELLEVPALGPLREWQRATRAVVVALLEERAAWRALAARHVAASRAALSAFAAYLREPGGPPITSLRTLHDAWTTIADRSWRDTLMGDGYARAFARWVDAGSALRAAWAVADERDAALSGRPTRAAFEALTARQARLEAELARLRGERVAMAEQPPVAPEPDAAAMPPAATENALSPVTAGGVTAASPARARAPRQRVGTPSSKAPARTKPAVVAARKARKAPAKASRGAASPRSKQPEFDIGAIVDGRD